MGGFWGSINLGEFNKIIVGFKMVMVVGKVIGDVLLGGLRPLGSMPGFWGWAR